MTKGREFAETVLAAFAAAGLRTDMDIARVNGPSTSTMTKLRKAAAGETPLAEPRKDTFERIDRAARWAVGSAARVWRGGEPDPAPLPEGVRPIGDPADDLVEFHVSGAFGVKAVVKGPIRDIDALQAAVSKLISGMNVGEAREET